MRRSTGWKRRLSAVALAGCTAASVPVGGGIAQAAAPVPTVFFGDSYTSNYGIAPLAETDPAHPRYFCFRAKDNYPAVATRRLADRGIALRVQDDRSCGAATISNFWEEQALLPPLPLSVPPQQEAVTEDTRLVVGSMGGNTLGFARILKQCSQRLRGAEGVLLPGEPVDGNSPAGECRRYFETGDGAKWLNSQLETVGSDLEGMFDRIRFFSGERAKAVLVGYPRLVPENERLCSTPVPGSRELPFADIEPNTLDFLDQVETRLNKVMADSAREHGARFVDLYAVTGGSTACNGQDRGIGGLLEPSEVKLGDAVLPWYAHPNPAAGTSRRSGSRTGSRASSRTSRTDPREPGCSAPQPRRAHGRPL
ncbi:SGNH/GDSL hydrolase family protein [Kitasatospora acidiphila]|uniref:SGNH/GDSL hydrolase family protein n=1 Tax=Kitasatospora acidiphila TaxID=2567942 RepID=UPI001E35AC8D|nr:SGNH/GDSL hydrolase family protein [Kitasatospora acidiphila]